jgi:aminobenzoyl-glutamate utilization protein B
MADAVLAVLDRNADAAAATTHCRVHSRWVARNRPGLPNHTLARITWNNLEWVGPPGYDDEAVRVARELQTAAGVEAMQDPFLPETRQLIAPWDAEERLRRYVPAWQRNWTSDDYVEMSWYAPTVRFYTARPALRVPPGHPGYPAWVLNALGGIPGTIDPTVRTTGKVIAGTLLDLLRQPNTLEAARTEHARRIEEYGALATLLPPDFAAPIDYRWPEYVDTARGSGWWIPDNPEI